MNEVMINESNLQKIDSFNKKINESPNPLEIKVNKAAGNSKYLPISFVEMTLDEVFMGHWSWEMKNFHVIANEIVGHGILTVVHPITGATIIRSGSGAVMIQQRKDSEITDISAKFKNTLVKDFPHLEAECLKSAARKLGKLFGRDLNRENEDEYESVFAENDLKAIGMEILNSRTEIEVKNVWEKYAHLQSDKKFRATINARINEIKSFDK